MNCCKKVILLCIALLSSTMLFASCSDKNLKETIEEATNQVSIYVSTDGLDSNPGTKSAPLRTIAKGLQLAKGGDTVFVRQGIYSEKVLMTKSGSSGKEITLKAYLGEKPVIDGTGMTVVGSEALVTIRNASFFTLEGFEICNLKSASSGVDVNGIVVDQGSGGVKVLKNRVHHIENNARPEDGRSGHGILVLGNTEVAMKNIIIEGNEIYDCNTGYSENLTVNGYVDGFILRKNKVYNGENIGIVAAGGYAANPNPAYNYVRNGLITENEVYGIDGTTGPIPAYSEHNGAIGIYIDGAKSIIVERNSIHDSGRGIGIVSETDNFPTSDCIVRNNLIYNNSLAGISLGGYLNYTGGGTYNCYVVNNTLYNNSKVNGYFGEVEGEIRLTENCFDNVIRNNLIYAGADRVYIHKYTETGYGNILGHNLYYSISGGKWVWNGQAYLNFISWKSALAGDDGSIDNIDPSFFNVAERKFHIQVPSVAKNSGAIISANIQGVVDKDGNPRIVNNNIDIGAYELP